jgi:hypothetical protein
MVGPRLQGPAHATGGGSKKTRIIRQTIAKKICMLSIIRGLFDRSKKKVLEVIDAVKKGRGRFIPQILMTG